MLFPKGKLSEKLIFSALIIVLYYILTYICGVISGFLDGFLQLMWNTIVYLRKKVFFN